MGKEIVYCQGCGTNLREEDFEKGRAHRVENRPFCVECKPAPSPKAETPRARKTSTGRIPVATPPAARRPVPSRAAQTRNLPLLIGGVIAALLVLLILIVMASRAGRPRPPASSAPEQGAAPAPVPAAAPTDNSTDARLAQIREFLRGDPLFMRRAEAVRRMDDARREAGPRAGEIDRLRADYDRSYDEAARRLADFARGEAERLAARRKLDDAIRTCDDYLESFGPAPPAQAIRRLRQDLDRQRNP